MHIIFSKLKGWLIGRVDKFYESKTSGVAIESIEVCLQIFLDLNFLNIDIFLIVNTFLRYTKLVLIVIHFRMNYY